MRNAFLNLRAIILSQKSKTPDKVAKILLRNILKIATAESCTGGLVSSRLTDVTGSSNYIRANYVTYSKEAKHNILGVSQETLDKFGAISPECAYEMADGLLKITGSDVVICTTGVAGPSTDECQPVGLMYAACGYNGNITVKKVKLNPNYSRKNMKFMFSEEALKLVIEILKDI